MQQKYLLITYYFNILLILLTLTQQQHFTTVAKAIDLLDSSQLSEYSPNYCNNSELVENAGLIRSTLGQFLGFECSAEFYHCRWQSDGFRTYKKLCRPGLVYDTLGTQNCNYDYNVKGCTMQTFAEDACTSEQFLCPLSEICVNMSQRCDGKYDCALEEDEQNCPICQPNFFPCVASEQCIPMTRRCDGFADCSDGTDEMNCEACPTGWFFCKKSKQCIKGSERCDGIEQCHTGEDEALCKFPKDQEFICEDRNHKIPIAQFCDGIEQCPDRSDEFYCHRNVDLTPLTFLQKNGQAIIPYSSIELTGKKNSEDSNDKERKLETIKKIDEYKTENTTVQASPSFQKTTLPLLSKTSFSKSPNINKIPLLRNSHYPLTTTTESSNQEFTTLQQTLHQIENDYEDESAFVTVPNQIQQQIDEMPFHKTSSNLLFPQNHVLSSGVQKIMPQKIKPATMLTVAEPKVEVAHSVDYFPFLKSLTLQKASNVPQAAKLSDMTLKKTKNHSLSKSHFLTTPKREKITLKEITVPLQQNIPTTTEILETVKQTKSRNIKFLKTTSLSPHPFAASQVQKQKQSTTRKPESTTFETPEAEILHRIGSHFKTNKSGKTLSTKDLLKKIEMLLTKEESNAEQKSNKMEFNSKEQKTSMELQYSNAPSSYQKSLNTVVTKRPPINWRPSLSSGPIRSFTSLIKRPTTHKPIINYADVQMRHSDSPNEEEQPEDSEQDQTPFPRFSIEKAIQSKSYSSKRTTHSTAFPLRFQGTNLFVI